MADTKLPVQSIIIPIRNEEKFIASTVQYLQEQDYPKEKFEIIIVDGHSSDGTPEIIKRLSSEDPRIRVLHNPKRLSSAARNIGAKAATGEIITYIDGHTFIDNPKLLRNIAVAMSEKEVTVLSRPQFLETPDNTPFQRAVSLARRSILGHGLDSTIYLAEDKYVGPSSSGASYKREIFDKVGYFDERFDAAEDWEFNYRVHLAGYGSFSSLGFAVYYYPRATLKGLFYQMKRYGVGRFRFFRKHRAGLGSGALFPVLLVAGIPMLLVLAVLWPIFVPLLLLAAGVYVLANLSFSIYIAARHGWGYLSKSPFIFLAIHWGLGWGFISESVNSLLGRRPWPVPAKK